MMKDLLSVCECVYWYIDHFALHPPVLPLTTTLKDICDSLIIVELIFNYVTMKGGTNLQLCYNEGWN